MTTNKTEQKIHGATAKTLRGIGVELGTAIAAGIAAKDSKDALAKANLVTVSRVFECFMKKGASNLTKETIIEKIVDGGLKETTETRLREVRGDEWFDASTNNSATTNGKRSMSTALTHFGKVATAISNGLIKPTDAKKGKHFASIKGVYDTLNAKGIEVPGYEMSEAQKKKQADNKAKAALAQTDTQTQAEGIAAFNESERGILVAIMAILGDDLTPVQEAFLLTEKGGTDFHNTVKGFVNGITPAMLKTEQAKAA